MHSSEWVSGTEYANKTALVVGFGNSGSEIALDLWEGGATSVTALVRSPIHMLPRDLVVAFKRPFWFARHYFPVWLGDFRHQDRLPAPLLGHREVRTRA